MWKKMGGCGEAFPTIANPVSAAQRKMYQKVAKL
jgi:hypothetical protein